MNKYFYDFHIHSCLSPCADDDMTVNNIAGMASLCGLNIIALTDHNTCGNCKSFYEACRKNGIVPVAGIEMTTAEEIHVIALFEFLENALEFEADFSRHRTWVKNKTEIFGNQLFTDSDDNVTGTDDFLLPVATDLTLECAVALAESYGAFAYPAHIDRTSNGIVSILGTFPEKPRFSAVEFADRDKVDRFTALMPSVASKKLLISSDAHNLWKINEAENHILLDDEPYSSALVRKRLFEYLRADRL